MTTQALLPSENWLALPAVITPPGQRRADLAHRLERRVGADALVAIDRDLARAERAGGRVGDAHGGGHRHDLILELAGRLRRGRAQLAAHAVLVLRLLGDVIALGHDSPRSAACVQ